MEPARPGRWRWCSDRVLGFFPDTDWPADQKFRIHLDRAILGPRTLPARYGFEVSTPPFSGQVRCLEFYTDSTNPADPACTPSTAWITRKYVRTTR